MTINVALTVAQWNALHRTAVGELETAAVGDNGTADTDLASAVVALEAGRRSKPAPAEPAKSGVVVGLTEIAENAGVKYKTAHNWYRRGTLPKPLAVLANGPVWDINDILKWKRAWNA